MEGDKGVKIETTITTQSIKCNLKNDEQQQKSGSNRCSEEQRIYLTQMLTAALLVIAKIWKLLRCTSVGEWISK